MEFYERIKKRIPLAKISVSEIVAECGTTLQTFYWHFQGLRRGGYTEVEVSFKSSRCALHGYAYLRNLTLQKNFECGHTDLLAVDTLPIHSTKKRRSHFFTFLRFPDSIDLVGLCHL